MQGHHIHQPAQQSKSKKLLWRMDTRCRRWKLTARSWLYEHSLQVHSLHAHSLQAKSKKLLWRMNKGIVKDLLPQVCETAPNVSCSSGCLPGSVRLFC